MVGLKADKKIDLKADKKGSLKADKKIDLKADKKGRSQSREPPLTVLPRFLCICTVIFKV